LQCNTHKSVPAETLNQNENSLRDIKRQHVAEASAVHKSDTQVPAAPAAESSNVGLAKDVEMTEADGKDDASEERHSGHHSRDDEVELFAVEAIKGCKVNPRVCRFLGALYFHTLPRIIYYSNNLSPSRAWFS
jgi:hypothetical protein